VAELIAKIVRGDDRDIMKIKKKEKSGQVAASHGGSDPASFTF